MTETTTEPPATRRVTALPRWVLPALALIGLALVLAPARLAPLRGDDVFMSEISGYLTGTHQSIPGVIWHHWGLSLDLGRPQLIHVILLYVVHDAFNDASVAYHLYLIALTTACAGMLWILLRRFGAPPALALLAVALLATTIQLRLYHDAQTGYFGVIQLLLLVLLTSTYLLMRYVQEGDRRWFWWSFAVFAPAPLLYELAYPLVLVHVLLLMTEMPWRKGLRRAVPFIAYAVGWLSLSLILRAISDAPPDPGYAITGTVPTIIETYLRQLLAPLPAAYPYFNHGQLAGPTRPEELAAAWRALAVVGAVLIAAVPLRRQVVDVTFPALRRTLVLGVSLLLSPVVLLSVAQRYQAELTKGIGYLPVLMQEFGVAAMLAAGAVALLRWANRFGTAAYAVATLVVALPAGVAAYVVGYNNIRVVATEQPQQQTRNLIEAGMKAGALRDARPGTTVVFDPRDVQWPWSWQAVPWAFEAMLLDRTGHVFDAKVDNDPLNGTCPPQPGFPPANCSPVQAGAVMVRARAFRGGGTVIVAPLAGTTAKVPLDQVVPGFTAWERGSTTTPPPIISADRKGRPWQATPQNVRWAKVDSPKGWSVFRATVVAGPKPRATELTNPRARFEFTSPLPPQQLASLYGTKRLLP